MEDQHVLIDDLNAEFPDIFKDNARRSFYAVFDGHGGKNTAIFVRKHLLTNIVRNPAFLSDPEEAIRKGFFATDEQILESQRKEGWMDGSTAAIAFVIDDDCWVANSGDSEVVLGLRDDGDNNKYKAMVMTVIHRPDTKEEKKRLDQVGAVVFRKRVGGTLAVSRGFGDGNLKEGENGSKEDWVSADPAVRVEKIKSGDVLLLACDGLWDVFGHHEALEYALKSLKSTGSIASACDALVEEALKKGSTDNITCVLVTF
jgi:serine/threonine protein phosphatase PrpC